MKIETLEKEITSAGQVVKISEDLDKDYKRLTGIAILWTMGKHSILLSSSVGNKDIKKLPKKMEAAFVQTNTYIAPNDRMWDLDEKADGERFELEFQDGGQKASYPYTLKIYLRLEGCQNG